MVAVNTSELYSLDDCRQALSNAGVKFNVTRGRIARFNLVDPSNPAKVAENPRVIGALLMSDPLFYSPEGFKPFWRDNIRRLKPTSIGTGVFYSRSGGAFAPRIFVPYAGNINMWFDVTIVQDPKFLTDKQTGEERDVNTTKCCVIALDVVSDVEKLVLELVGSGKLLDLVNGARLFDMACGIPLNYLTSAIVDLAYMLGLKRRLVDLKDDQSANYDKDPGQYTNKAVFGVSWGDFQKKSRFFLNDFDDRRAMSVTNSTFPRASSMGQRMLGLEKKLLIDRVKNAYEAGKMGEKSGKQTRVDNVVMYEKLQLSYLSMGDLTGKGWNKIKKLAELFPEVGVDTTSQESMGENMQELIDSYRRKYVEGNPKTTRPTSVPKEREMSISALTIPQMMDYELSDERLNRYVTSRYSKPGTAGTATGMQIVTQLGKHTKPWLNTINRFDEHWIDSKWFNWDSVGVDKYHVFYSSATYLSSFGWFFRVPRMFSDLAPKFILCLFGVAMLTQSNSSESNEETSAWTQFEREIYQITIARDTNLMPEWDLEDTGEVSVTPADSEWHEMPEELKKIVGESITSNNIAEIRDRVYKHNIGVATGVSEGDLISVYDDNALE